MTTGLARVTICAPQRRIDVALPEQLPLAELLPEVLRHAGEGLADDGERHGGWLLRRANGAVLTTAQALHVQGVRDGEVLHLVPAQDRWPDLEYDDVVEAIADGARRRGGAWSARATRIWTLAGGGVLLGVGLVAVLTGGPDWSGSAIAALVAAGVLTVAGTVASRAYADGLAGAAVAGYGLPYAFAGGALLVASGDSVGLSPLRWLGAAELLAGSMTLLLAAVLGLVGAAVYVRVFVAGATIGLFGGGAALAGLFLASSSAAALLLTVLVFAVAAVPLLAIRLGKMPMPPMTLPATATGTADGEADAARELPDRSKVFAAVARSEEMMSGMLLSVPVLTGVAAAVLTASGGSGGRVLVAVTALSLLLRSRLFVAVRHRVPLLVAGLIGLVLLGVDLVQAAGSGGLLGLLVGGLVVALLTVAAGATYSRRPASPYLARAADVADTLLVVSVVPVACAVLGLYGRARGLLG